MEILTKQNLNVIENQTYNRARDIDVSIMNALLDNEYKDYVLDGLMLYVNKDGGFGNALHIDNYNPNSSVYQTYEAFRILDLVGLDSSCENPLLEEIVNKACNFLFNRCQLKDGAWNPNEKTNNNFAHSEEFTYYESFISSWGYHPTAALVGFTLTLVKPNKAYYKKALKMLDIVFKYFETKESLSIYDYISFNSLLGSLKKANLFVDKQEIIEDKLLAQAPRLLENKDFSISAMMSNCKLDEKLNIRLNEELDEIILSRASHGLWEHKKGWGTDKYAEADSAMLKWLGAESVYNLYLLNKYNRIEK